MLSGVEVLHEAARFRLGRPRLAVLEREAFPIAVIAMWLIVLTLWLPNLLVSDSWLALVNGRYVSEHGLPRADTLTAWMNGRPWVDQQWAAHWILFQLVHHGGLRLAIAVTLACVAGALTLAAVAARKLGASARNTAVVAAVPVIAAPWIAQVRTQTLALVPFVLVYSLLALDSRRRGRRVLLTLPLLAAWANVHGSVVLAAGLTALYGVGLLLRRGARAHGALLAVGAPLAVLLSPYGLDLVDYYRLMLLHPPFAGSIVEWSPATFGPLSLVFFLSAFAAAGLWSSHRHVLTRFERWALPLLLLASLQAMRNAIWLELAFAVSVPRLLDAVWPSVTRLTTSVRRANRAIAFVMLAAAALVCLARFSHSPTWLDPRAPAAARIALAAGETGVVLADDRHADWLLWEQPSLEGRVAYDVRFELFDAAEMAGVRKLHSGIASTWRGCGATARVVTFAGAADAEPVLREGLLAPGARKIFDAPDLQAFTQPVRAGTACRLSG